MIQLVLYLVFMFCFGYSFVQKNNEQDSVIESIALSTLVGIAVHVLSAHLLALVFGDFVSCSLFTLACMFVYLLIFVLFSKLKAKQNFFNFSKLQAGDFIALLSSFAFAFSFALRELNFGNPDRGHLAFSASIFHNSLYPPAHPTGIDFSMAFYHYGVDLILVVFRKISGFSAWDATSFQIGLGAFLTFVSIYALLRHFIEQKTLALVLTLVAVFYTSINSLQFFVQELPSMAGYGFFDLMKKWLLVSWTSVSHITSQLRLLGQNFGLPILFSFLSLLMSLIQRNTKAFKLWFAFLTLSFLLYFCYPSYWYPVFASVTVFVALSLIFNIKESRSNFVYFISLPALIFLGKYLCFTASHTSFDGISAMKLSPGLNWVHWGKAYIRYFYDLNYLSQLKTTLDHMMMSQHLVIPLFSSISFREFGFSFFLALVIFVRDAVRFVKSKALKIETIFFFIAGSSFLVPFLFQFILRPIETSRFLFVAKIFALLYVLVYIGQRSYMFKPWFKTILIVVLFFLLIPGVVSILPDTRLAILGNKKLTNRQKNIIAELETIHKDGDVILDDGSFEGSFDIASISGFYGVGGQFFKIDKATRLTALKTLDCKLLKELAVDYVLIDKSKYKTLAFDYPYLHKAQLQNPDYLLFEFDKDYQITDDYEQSYEWTLAYQIAQSSQLQYITQQNRQKILKDDRSQIIELLPNIKKSLAAQNPILAIWLKEHAVVKEGL